jgi:phosphomannomutase
MHPGDRALDRAWALDDPDPVTRAALEASSGAGGALPPGAGAPVLRFGTSGLRGPLGPGPSRVNRVTARRLTVGLLGTLGPDPLVVVGGDARHGSDEMVADVVDVVIASGGRVVRATEPCPTPLLAFAVRHLGADAAVVVTASHNPATDNGLKVYSAEGIQVIPPVDQEIAAALAEPLSPHLRAALERGPRASGDPLPDEVRDAYRSMAAGLVPAAVRRTTIVHTSLHGVAGRLAGDVLADAGFAVVPVPSQAAPHPDFPTVTHPNPEDPAALAAALALAEAREADLVLAHDPDGDRLAVAVPDDGRWRVLSGNEVGALLCDLMCETVRSDLPRVVASTLVSTALVARIAAHHGVRHVRTPTGFKWVMRASLDPGTRFVFGFEEALGYAVTDAVRDKDGITAGLVVADLVDRLGPGGAVARLDELAARHGRHTTRTLHRSFTGPGAAAERAMAMTWLRDDPPPSLGGDTVEGVVDHLADAVPTDMVELRLASGATVKVRPSGTEPTVKVYLEVVVADPGEAEQALDRLVAALPDR